jgi:phosphotransferase system enzyme I (PtsP)
VRARDIVQKANAVKKTRLCGRYQADRRAGADRARLSLAVAVSDRTVSEGLILDLDATKAEAMIKPLLDAPADSVSIRQKKMTEFWKRGCRCGNALRRQRRFRRRH